MSVFGCFAVLVEITDGPNDRAEQFGVRCVEPPGAGPTTVHNELADVTGVPGVDVAVLS